MLWQNVTARRIVHEHEPSTATRNTEKMAADSDAAAGR